jgi:glycogen synthase
MNVLLAAVMREDAPTGVSTVTRVLRSGLARAGHAVELATPAEATGWERALVRLAGAPFRWGGPVSRMRRDFWKSYAEVRAACGRARMRPDVIHAQDLGAALAARDAFGGKVPVVVMCHFNDHPVPEMLQQNHGEELDAGPLWDLYAMLFKKQSRYLCVSHYVEEKIRPYLPEGTASWVVHNGIDFEAFARPEADPEWVRKWEGRKVILNVGHLEPRKNQRLLIEAAAHLDDSYLIVFLGGGPDREMLEAEAAKAGVERRVEFLGRRKDVAAVMKASGLCLHVARNENCPMTLIEAVACGLPVWALRVGGIPEMFGETAGECLLDAGIAPEDLARRLQIAFASPGTLGELARRQKLEAAEEFSEARMIGRIVKVYQECLV